jgi:hydrogenase expression/formation protein HypC
MCLGFPMRIVSGDDLSAIAERDGERRTISMLLSGAVAPGTAVLVHLGSAVRVLDDEEAGFIEEAIAGLIAADRGEDVVEVFPDLVGRTAQLASKVSPGEGSA